jgi:hypothetical protein
MENFRYEGGKTIILGRGTSVHLPPDTMPEPEAEAVTPAVTLPGEYTKVDHTVPRLTVPQHEVRPEPTAQEVATYAHHVTEVVPHPAGETPVTTAETHRRYGAGKVGVFFLVGALAVVGGKFVYDNLFSAPDHAPAKAEAVPQPPADDAGGTPLSLIPVPGGIIIPNLLTPSPEASITIHLPATSAAPSSSKQPAPRTTTHEQVPTPASTLKLVMPPKATSPDTAPPTVTSESTSAPSTTAPEQAKRIDVAPSETSIRLLSQFADPERAAELESQYPDIDQYLRLSTVDFLSKKDVEAYQQNLGAVYGNSAARHILGDPQLLGEDSLRDRRATGESPAPVAVGFTDNSLRKAGQLFPLVGDDISKTAYLNEGLSDRLTEQLSNGEDVSVSDSSNEVILGDVREVHGVAVVPIVAEYTKDFATYNDFIWGALIPVTSSGDFIVVDSFRQTLSESTPAATENPTTPATSDPTPTPDSSNPQNTTDSNDDKPGKQKHRHHNER